MTNRIPLPNPHEPEVQKRFVPVLNKWTMGLIVVGVVSLEGVQWAYEHGLYPIRLP